jgi:hypothetical protein
MGRNQRGRTPRPRGRRDPFTGNPMRQMNQMTQATTGLVVGAGTLMLGFGALSMVRGMLPPP